MYLEFYFESFYARLNKYGIIEKSFFLLKSKDIFDKYHNLQQIGIRWRYPD